MNHANHALTTSALLLCACLAGCRNHVVVQWPDLKQLDDLAERCEALCDQKDVAALRKIAEDVKAAAITVALDPVPDGARQPDAINALQSDLSSLADSIRDPVHQDGAELTTILAGVHPIVEKLMEAAGMPHVHENEKSATSPTKEGQS
jgi:hypothetical protein